MSGVPGTQEEEKKPMDQSAHINLKVKGQNGVATKIEKSRKQMKERKNRARKIRGVKKTKGGDAAKGGKKK